MAFKFKTLIIVWSALALNVFGGWQGSDVWPAASQTSFGHVNGHTKSYWWAQDSTQAALERCAIAKLAGTTVSGPRFWRWERADLVALKASVLAISQSFLDKHYAVDGKYDLYYQSQGPSGIQNSLPTWDSGGTNLALYCGLPSDYFQVTPWVKLGSSQYGWDGIKKTIQACNWFGESGYWGTSTYSKVIGSCSWSDPRANCSDLLILARSNIVDGLYVSCEGSEAMPARRGFTAGFVYYGGAMLAVESVDSTPMLDYYPPSGGILPLLEMYIGSYQNGFIYGDVPSAGYVSWFPPLVDCGVTYVDGKNYTHYKQTKQTTGNVWTYAFTRIGSCSDFDLSIATCCVDNFDHGSSHGGWAAYGPFFVIKYETGSGLEYP